MFTDWHVHQPLRPCLAELATHLAQGSAWGAQKCLGEGRTTLQISLCECNATRLRVFKEVKAVERVVCADTGMGRMHASTDT